jgi:diguanylate cyclase (GGDEF)-like protein
MFNFQSLTFRMMALAIGLIAIATFVRVLIVGPFARELVREKAATEQLLTASYVAREIDHSLQVRRELIAELASSLPLALLRQPQQLAQWVRDRQRVNPLFDRGLLVLQADGSGLLVEYPVVAGRARVDYSGTDWFHAALQAEDTVIGRPQRSVLSGEPTLAMAIALRDAQGRAVAVLAGTARLNMAGFLDRLQPDRLGSDSNILLVSPADQLFVSASDPAMVLQATPAPGINALHDRAMNGYRGTGTVINDKGEQALSAMASVPSTGWFVVVSRPMAEVFELIRTLGWRVFWKTAPAVSILMLVLLWLLLPRMLRPLKDSAHAMREMADGKRELAQLPIPRQDEVGNLVAGFNYLVLRLRKKEADLKASELRLEFMAHHDTLTGLHARSMLEDRMQQAFARAQRHGSHFAILFCDLDNFKPINDQFGHAAGDAVLRQVAERLSAGRRQTDTVARLGGDEFIILLTELDQPHEAALNVAQQLLATLGQPFRVAGHAVTLGASIGVALYRADSMSGAELMSQADQAMYQAKREGKNRIHFFEPDQQS